LIVYMIARFLLFSTVTPNNAAWPKAGL